jgi:uncharacterized protein YneF (UPF0154 family)
MDMKFSRVLLFLILSIVLGIVGGLFISNNLKIDFFNKESNINITSTIKEILPNAEYSSLVYHYSSVITHSDVYKFYDINIPFTEKKAIYTIDGTIKLGLNCNDISVDSSYNNIVVRMPAIKILSHEIYPETFSLYDEHTSIFNRYTLQDANDIQMANKNEMEEKVRNNLGLFIQARQAAEQQFRLFIESIPGVKNQYDIVFEWQM